MRLVNSKIQLSASDLVNFLGCKHLTELDRKVIFGELEKPSWSNPAVAILHKKGLDHEAAFLEHLKNQKLSIADLSDSHSIDSTKDAMIQGFDVIYQAPLQKENWFGIADFLIRIKGESDLGNYHYQVQDTKLSRETKAATVIQLCLYNQIIEELQGTISKEMVVVKPDPQNQFGFDTFRFTEFQSYFNLVKAQFEKVIYNDPEITYPLPVSRCEICRWWKDCNAQWHEDDHLSLIAGIRSTHLTELERQEYGSLKEYAEDENPTRQIPEKGSETSYRRLHGQAKIQLKGRETKKPEFKLLAIEPHRGLNRLPEPSLGDLYFDIEGDHFYENGGLEYLLGWVFRQSNGSFSYSMRWGLNRRDERKAFEEFIEILMDQWNRYPDFHIYHFAPYEPAALKRLASRHASKEVEVDQLLRAERFIDLHAVIKESLQASVESYSLKQVEIFSDYSRKVDLFKAAAARRKIGLALDLKSPHQIDKSDFVLVEDYNRDDCLATEGIHRWLESVFQEAFQNGLSLTRPELKTGDASDSVSEMDERAQKLFNDLIKDLPENEEEWNEVHQAKRLLANLINYFRRESRSKYWEYFRLHELDEIEMLEERHGLSFLEFQSEFKPKRGNPIHRYRFPIQEVSITPPEKGVEEVLGNVIGEVVAISPEHGWVELKKTRNSVDIHPRAIHTGKPIATGILANSLHAFAESVIQFGLEDQDIMAAAKDLLLKNPPRLKGNMSFLPLEGETMENRATRVALNLDYSILPIQGPPGTGKTHIGASMIVNLVQEGKRIGVTAVSHEVIRNLLKKTIEIGEKKGKKIIAVHKTSDESEGLPEGLEEISSNSEALEALGNGKIVGGTSWLWAREEAEGVLDYLFVDEAGQMSLSNVISCSRATSNIILLGDPQQLEQPQQGAHPEAADVSALNHLLDSSKTMPESKGLFLDTTWRLPKSISTFTSELFYEDRLFSKPDTEFQEIMGDNPFSGSGLYYVPAVHEGNQNRSKEEIEIIDRLVLGLTSSNLKWKNSDKKECPIGIQDILIVAPYNAQVSGLINKIPDARIGTVDKFQGKQAPIVIYSMTSSSPEDAPRGMAFLYDPHRLNVATSRAQCISIIVGSPTLFKPDCHSVDQMRWANGLCRYKEMAKEVLV